uniref:AB hydrolase-1 domain-containing protein n=2 Tax=Clastoptera arizonana TaxID=38151 RepID=A0A1B6E0P9_9HEMI
MGFYDLAAFITKILSISKYPKLFYVGHSMGTTTFFVLMSTRPEFNKYIYSSALLSPVAFGVRKFKSSFFEEILKRSDKIGDFLKAIHLFDIPPRSKETQSLIRLFCSELLQGICLNVVGDVAGENRKNLNRAKVSDYINSIISGGSIKTLLHFAQVYKTGEFKRFDYGSKENRVIYEQAKPPNYHLERISSPVILFYSNNDKLIDEESIHRIDNLLPNIVSKELLPEYSHLDYVFGNDAPEKLYLVIRDMFNRISNNSYFTIESLVVIE